MSSEDLSLVVLQDTLSGVAFPAAPFPALVGGPGPECTIEADTDRAALQSWLARYRDNSPSTLVSFLKEADRLYRWAMIVAGKPLSKLRHEDFLRYFEFLKNPQPATEWVSATKFARTDSRWRPFSGPLSPASIRQARLIINNLYSWLTESGYIEGNPLALATKRATKKPHRKLARYLGPDLLQEVSDYLDQLTVSVKESGKKDPVTGFDLPDIERARWLFSVLFLTGIRISELCHAKMQQFSAEHRDGEIMWWLDVIGKGDKERRVPVGEAALAALMRYREFCGYPALPYPGDVMPLAASLTETTSSKSLSRSMVHLIVKSLAKGASEWVRQRGTPEAAFTANHLELMSAHWLRHSYGSALADQGADLRSIQANLGHEDISTTTIYLHRDDVRRHHESVNLAIGKKR